MNESLFVQLVDKFFPKLQRLIEKVNGKRNKDLKYYHKELLRKEYSADQKWESASLNSTYVAADVVAMDSPLPIKNRDVLSHSNGKLPKVGMKKVMRESDINTINIMKNRGDSFKTISSKLANDAVACATAIDEVNEKNFLEALSDGVILVPDEENTGTALRVDFGFLAENCFGVETAGEVTLEDIKKVLDKADADGNTIEVIFIAKTTYDKLRATRGAKELVADYNGQIYTDSTTLKTPTASQFDAAFQDSYGCRFEKVNRSVNIEKNGKRKPIKPFNANKLTFLVNASEVGALVWSTLAEATNPVPGVKYQTVDTYKLISKYSKNDPLQEFTASQALVLPVLENIDQIYSIDITEAQAVDAGETEGDANITIWGNSLVKENVKNALAEIGVTMKANASDADYIKAINALSNAKENKLKELLGIN